LKETRLIVGIVPYKPLNGDVAIPLWVVNFCEISAQGLIGLIRILIPIS
jgi:hypothetical protein